MEDDAPQKSRLQELLQQIKDNLNEQAWFQALQSKVEEIPSEDRYYFKLGFIASFVGAYLFYVASTMWSISSMKSQYIETQDLMRQIEGADQEIATLRQMLGGNAEVGDNAQGPIQQAAAKSEIAAQNVEILPGKAGTTEGSLKETLVDINVTGGLPKNLVQFAFELERSSMPIKLRYMKIEASPSENKMKSKYSVSAYTSKPNK